MRFGDAGGGRCGTRVAHFSVTLPHGDRDAGGSRCGTLVEDVGGGRCGTRVEGSEVAWLHGASRAEMNERQLSPLLRLDHLRDL